MQICYPKTHPRFKFGDIIGSGKGLLHITPSEHYLNHVVLWSKVFRGIRLKAISKEVPILNAPYVVGNNTSKTITTYLRGQWVNCNADKNTHKPIC